jgi:hypothetical protein
MSLLLADLDRWKDAGLITVSQHEATAALLRKKRFSVFDELNALLYIGVLAFIAGAGWTIQTYFARVGDVAIIFTLAASFAGALYYCFTRGAPYSNAQQESPTFAFDYVLYFGCLMLGLELGFIEYRFHLLQERWDHYLLLSALVYFVLAYRFDNRLVLSLALSTLAGWFGFRLFRLQWFSGSLRVDALVYSGLVAASGTALYRAGIKRHFLEAYLHVAVNVALAAAVAGVVDTLASPIYFLLLLAGAAASIVAGVRFARFAFVAYGVVYSYIGISDLILRNTNDFTSVMAYVAVSATIVIVLLVILARRFGRDA